MDACTGAHITALYLWQITILRAATIQRPATWLGLYVISENSPLYNLIPQVCKACYRRSMPGYIHKARPDSFLDLAIILGPLIAHILYSDQESSYMMLSRWSSLQLCTLCLQRLVSTVVSSSKILA